MGYLVKHIWESDFNEIGKLETMIDEWLGKATYELIDFNFVDVVIKEDNNSDARKLYGRYHYLPAISKSGYHIGAWLGDEHVACATFSHVTRKQIADRLKMKPKQVRELSRFCIIPTRNKTNFASWFMSRAVSRLKTSNSTIQALISFADTTLHDGTIYEASNWKYDGLTKKNYVYRSADARFYVHKKTVWDRAKKMGMSESEYADKHNYIKAWSKPKKRYLLSL